MIRKEVEKLRGTTFTKEEMDEVILPILICNNKNDNIVRLYIKFGFIDNTIITLKIPGYPVDITLDVGEATFEHIENIVKHFEVTSKLLNMEFEIVLDSADKAAAKYFEEKGFLCETTKNYDSSFLEKFEKATK